MADDVQSDIPGYTHQQIIRVITGIMLCIFLSSLDQTVIIPAVPAMAADLNAFGHLAWIVTAYLLTSTAATPIIGKLSDIWGRRALLIPSLIVFILASLACGFSQTLPQLIVARAVQGLGGAGLMSMAQASIADVVSPRERGAVSGLHGLHVGRVVDCRADPGRVGDRYAVVALDLLGEPANRAGGAGAVRAGAADDQDAEAGGADRFRRVGAAGRKRDVTVADAQLGGVELPWDSGLVIGLGVASVLMIARWCGRKGGQRTRYCHRGYSLTARSCAGC